MLADFEADAINERQRKTEEDNEVMELLSRFTAEMLKDALRASGGHPPPEWGDGETWRFYYLKECERRGRKLLLDLGWPIEDNSLYVNLHIGSVETLSDVAIWGGYFADRYTVDNHVWSVVEHWEPYDASKPNKYLVTYLRREIEVINARISRKKKLDTYDRSDKKKILAYEAMIEKELSKK